MLAARYLAGYPPELILQAEQLRLDGRLGDHLARRLPEAHEVRSDTALFDYVQALKQRHLRNAEPLNFVGYDARLRVLQHALGTHTRRTQVQGARLKMRREIRVASLFSYGALDQLTGLVFCYQGFRESPRQGRRRRPPVGPCTHGPTLKHTVTFQQVGDR